MSEYFVINGGKKLNGEIIVGTAGANLEIDADYVIVKPVPNFRAINVKTCEYPDLATDLQVPLTVSELRIKNQE